MNPDYLEMPLNICHRIPSLVTIDNNNNNNKDLNNNDDLVSAYVVVHHICLLGAFQYSKNKLHPTRFGVSSSIQIPRISSLKLLKNVCQPPYHSMPLFRSVCLYAVALETNFIVDEQVLENCIDYLWNDNDCVGKERIGDISKNTVSCKLLDMYRILNDKVSSSHCLDDCSTVRNISPFISFHC